MTTTTKKALSAKNAKAASVLLNSYLAAEIMCESARTEKNWEKLGRWKANRRQAAEQLFEQFGIWIAGETKDPVG